MPQATLYHGSPLMTDYTPGGAVVAGDVIVIGDGVRIAHLDIAANILGALGAGFGVYTATKATGGGTAIADNKPVWWDDTNNRIAATNSSGTHKFFGVTVKASLDADATQYVLHLPAHMEGLVVAGGAGSKFAAGEVTLDGTNPTSVAAATTGLATVVSAHAVMKKATSPGDDPTVLTVDYGGAVPAGRLDIYAWKT
ncbi:MAG TPA: DUF2190 family protein, partial [Candidatus Limnocylindrales bacterium]|nr:DUF2190 family protein [Candidatus Limnocylindrales bacterium]